MKPVRYVAKAVPGEGWRVWDRKMARWWGNYFESHPAALLRELNKDSSSPAVVRLARTSRPGRQARERQR
jgi:hypothetical protein